MERHPRSTCQKGGTVVGVAIATTSLPVHWNDTLEFDCLVGACGILSSLIPTLGRTIRIELMRLIRADFELNQLKVG